MKGLFKKVCHGRIHRIPKTYSNDLWVIVRQMLHVDPRQRPDCGTLLKMPIITSREKQFLKKQSMAYINQSQTHSELLKTIIFPKNINQFNQRLPGPRYDAMSEMVTEDLRQPGGLSSKNTYSTSGTKETAANTRESQPRKDLKGNASVHKQISQRSAERDEKTSKRHTTKESEVPSAVKSTNMNGTVDASSLETPVGGNPSIGSVDRPELSLPSIRRAREPPVAKEPQTVKRQKQVAQMLNASLDRSEAQGGHNRSNVKGILVNRKAIRPSPSQLVMNGRKNVIDASSIGTLPRKRKGRNMAVVNASTNDVGSIHDGLAEDSIHSQMPSYAHEDESPYRKYKHVQSRLQQQ